MAMGSGLIALALLAADGPSSHSEETTTFQVRVLTIDGLDWRTSAYSRLTPVTRQGTSAIWTADKALASQLVERSSSVALEPKLVAAGEANFSMAHPVSYVAAMDRVADGPINQSTALAFLPRPERVDERFSIRLAGRSLDQGMLTRVTLEETHVDAMHKVPQTESVRFNKEALEIDKSLDIRTSTETTRSITASVQIPEISQTRIDGEWVIPRDGVLLISLGVKTTAGGDGKAVVRERLAMIEANPSTVPTSSFHPTPYSKLSMPPTPMRSIPQGVDANGVVNDLPPLPEALASNDLDRIKPEPNQPSPQSRIMADPESDPSLARTSFDAAPLAPNPPLVEASETTASAHSARLKKLQEALAKAGFDLEINVDANDPREITLTRPACDKCDADGLFCAEYGRSPRQTEAPGSMKLVGEKAAILGVSIKDAEGFQFGDSVIKLEEALKSPGKTETTVLPMGDRFSIEIKATVVPRTNAKATAQKDEFTEQVRRNGGLGPN